MWLLSALNVASVTGRLSFLFYLFSLNLNSRSKFNKDVGYKINTGKSTVFLYTSNERSEIEIFFKCPLQ